MKNKLKRCMLILLAVMLVASCVACDSSVPTVFDDGSTRFGQGKFEEDYSLPNSGALLDRLIEDFSGSLEPPFSEKMDDSEYDDAQKGAEGDTATPDGQKNDVAEVGNYDQLKQAFYDAYVPSARFVRFKLVNGYTVNFTGDLLEDVYRELQRQDPIGVSAVSSWKYGVRGSEYIVEVNYNIEVNKLNRMKSETPALVKKAIGEMNTNAKNHYEIICAVNEYLCDTITYPDKEPYAPETHTGHGAFYGDAVCEGYAIAAKLMLNELGVKCDIQVGFCTDGGGHAWNLVELENNWYQMDVTWNDGSPRRTDYLLVTDEYMKKSRSWDEADYPKSATTPYKK